MDTLLNSLSMSDPVQVATFVRVYLGLVVRAYSFSDRHKSSSFLIVDPLVGTCYVTWTLVPHLLHNGCLAIFSLSRVIQVRVHVVSVLVIKQARS